MIMHGINMHPAVALRPPRTSDFSRARETAQLFAKALRKAGLGSSGWRSEWSLMMCSGATWIPMFHPFEPH